MKGFPVNIINTTENHKAKNTLKLKLENDGFECSESNTAIEGYSNLLITAAKDNYQNQDEDPYYKIRQACPNAAIQNCYPNSLLDEKGKLSTPVYEVMIKELLLKHEIIQQDCLLPVKIIPEEVQFIFPYSDKKEDSDDDDEDDSNEKKWRFFRLQIFQKKMQFYEINQIELNELVKKVSSVNDGHSQLIKGKKSGKGERFPLVFWPSTGDYLFFVQSDMVALSEFEVMKQILKKVDESRNKPLTRDALKEFIAEYPENSAGQLLWQLFAAEPKLKELDYSVLRDELKKHFERRRKEKDILFNWLKQRFGLTWNQSLQSKENGFLNAHLGFYLNHDERIYYAGAIGSPQICHLYRLVSNLKEIPQEIVDLFSDVLHIRHKKNTVLPYPFKYLREYSETAVRLSNKAS